MTGAAYLHIATLEAARERLLRKPETRAVRSWARDAFGLPVCPTDDTACSFCVLGDILRHLGLTKDEAEARAAHTASRALLLDAFDRAFSALDAAAGPRSAASLAMHIDALSAVDAADLVQRAIDHERERLAPR